MSSSGASSLTQRSTLRGAASTTEDAATSSDAGDSSSSSSSLSSAYVKTRASEQYHRPQPSSSSSSSPLIMPPSHPQQQHRQLHQPPEHLPAGESWMLNDEDDDSAFDAAYGGDADNDMHYDRRYHHRSSSGGGGGGINIASSPQRERVDSFGRSPSGGADDDATHGHFLGIPRTRSRRSSSAYSVHDRRMSDEDVHRVTAENLEWQRWKETHPYRPLPRLMWKLLTMFVFTGPQWLWMLFRLLLYVVCLAPVWPRLVYTYVTSPYLMRNIQYGPHARNYCDIYVPTDYHTNSEPIHMRRYPVVVFMSGGAWIIGYKAWTLLSGIVASATGILFVSPDYRNYPQGTVSDMLQDASSCMQWVFECIDEWGGDADNITLVGQSAGAHLSALMLLQQAKRQHKLAAGKFRADEWTKTAAWPIMRLRGFLGVSGPYDLCTYEQVLAARGLHPSVLYAIMEGRAMLPYHSPTQRVLRASFRKLAKYMPPMAFVHGSDDQSVPTDSTTALATALRAAGVPVTVKIYERGTHTDIILENLMRPQPGPLCTCDASSSASDAATLDGACDDVNDDGQMKQHQQAQPPLSPQLMVDMLALVRNTHTRGKHRHLVRQRPDQLLNPALALTHDEVVSLRAHATLVPACMLRWAKYVCPF